MTIPQQTPRKKRYVVFALGLIVVLFGAVTIAWNDKSYSFGLLCVGLAALMTGSWLVRVSNVHAQPSPRLRLAVAGVSNRPGRVTWALTGASLVACGVTYYILHLDVLHGGKEGWPVWAFFFAVTALVLSAGYVVATLKQR